jgi:hypothetical protein
LPSGGGAVADSFAHLGEAALLGRVCGDAFSQLVSALLLVRHVLLDFLPMIEVIGQTRVNVGEAQHRESQDNFFSARALLIVMHDGFETDARASNPNRAVFQDDERHLLRLFKPKHNGIGICVWRAMKTTDFSVLAIIWISVGLTAFAAIPGGPLTR